MEGEGELIDLGEAGGRRTAIGRALEQGLRRAAARPLAGVVLLSLLASATFNPLSIWEEEQQ